MTNRIPLLFHPQSPGKVFKLKLPRVKWGAMVKDILIISNG
jgi:hypothetical protein